MLLMGRVALSDTNRPDPEGTPTRVAVGIYVSDVDEISTSGQSFIANVFYMYQWKDPRLANGGPDLQSMPLEKVWNPRIQIVNQQRLQSTMPEVVTVTGQGQVTYRQRVWGSFSQPLTLNDFPFDKQDFSIQLISIGYSPEEVALVALQEQDVPGQTTGGIAEHLSVADWKVGNWEQAPYTLEPVPGIRRSAFALTFEGTRLYGYFVAKVIIPLILIVAMSWVVFWIDPEQSGTQVSVAVTAMLTLIAYRFAVGTDLPRISYMTRLDYFILGATFLVFASLLEVMITSSLARSGRLYLARSLDTWSRWLFPGAFVALTVRSLII